MRPVFRLLAPAVLLITVAALLALTVLRNRVYENSVAVWESMAAASPSKRRPHQNLGQALSAAGKLHEALNEFKTVLALDDDGSVPMRDIYREIGVVYFRLGLYDESVIAWQKGLQFAPLDPGLLNNLAIAYLKLNRMDEALSHAQIAARNNPYMPEPVNTLGEIYLSKGEPRKAAEQFKRYLYLRPEDSRGYWNAALSLRESGDLEGALEHATRFLAREQDPAFRRNAVQLVEHLRERLGKPRR